MTGLSPPMRWGLLAALILSAAVVIWTLVGNMSSPESQPLKPSERPSVSETEKELPRSNSREEAARLRALTTGLEVRAAAESGKSYSVENDESRRLNTGSLKNMKRIKTAHPGDTEGFRTAPSALERADVERERTALYEAVEKLRASGNGERLREILLQHRGERADDSPDTAGRDTSL